ncbi:MAG TPA: FAD-dependent thymidylate synthase [bacterium]|nr:FAD-dependent thymidylate synthase [bacterium]
MTDTDDQPNAHPRLNRVTAPELDRILGHRWPVLDDGFVRVVDYLGSDEAIVQAARVSYGAGTKAVHEDAGLIRYLMRHRHTTPFEMCEIKLHVRVPMDTWRQWIRHRTACLAAGTAVIFDLPGGTRGDGRGATRVAIEELYARFRRTATQHEADEQRHPSGGLDGVRAMRLRQMNEDTGAIQHTRVVNVYKNGMKPVFRVHLEDGKWIECTADHRFKFADGWKTLTAETGLRLSGGRAVWAPGDYLVHVNGRTVLREPLHRDRAPLHAARGRVVATLVRIAQFEYAGEKETYDLEVAGPYHNFVANGIVTHNSVNEYSTRYSVAIDAAAKTAPDEWRLQSSRNKQGSAGFLHEDAGQRFTQREADLQRLAREVYEERLAAGVAREQARKDLPLSTYTEAYWKTDLHNLLQFLALRADDHAQAEIRAYALVIGNEIVRRWCPIAWQAFQDYRMNSLVLTALDVEVVRRLISGDRDGAVGLATRYGWLAMKDGKLRPNRERAEASRKLRALGIDPPW